MKTKKFLVSIILIMLIFFTFTTSVHASLFSDDDNKTDIEETIDKDDRRFIRKNNSKNDSVE